MKKKDKSETEYLRGQIRQLKAQVKNLRKELSRFEKIEPEEEELEIVNELEPKAIKCPLCPGNVIKTNIQGIRMIETCSECDYRKVWKKNSKTT
jgi:hypothetical protein